MLTHPHLPRLLATTLLFTSLTVSAAAQSGSIKIAVVDLERVVALSKHGKALQTKLSAFEKRVKEQHERMSDDAKAIQQRAAEGAQSLSEEKLAELQRQYQDKLIQIRRFTEEKQREGQKMQQEGLQAIERAMEPVFKAVQQELGLDLILNHTAGIVVMASERIDITQKIIDRLDD